MNFYFKIAKLLSLVSDTIINMVIEEDTDMRQPERRVIKDMKEMVATWCLEGLRTT